ncbi:MAG: GHKL domain-containing protein [Deltaproteobacteria bacterium]|nr:GHKL domain-containing protein [Deltaproteobacteria bacterium]
MSLQRKYLLLVNVALLTIFIAHVVHDQATLRRELLRLEVRNLTQLANTLGRGGFDAEARPNKQLAHYLEALAPGKRGLEVLVIDQRSVVVAGQPEKRIGKHWKESDISAVLAGRVDHRWKIDNHFHDDRPMIDVTVAVRTQTGKVRHVVHIARDLRLVSQMIADRFWGHAAWTLSSLVVVALLVNFFTVLWIIRPIRRLKDTLRDSRWFRDSPSSKDELEQLSATVKHMIAELDRAVSDRESKLDKQEHLSRGLRKEVVHAMDKVDRIQAEFVQRERLSAVGELAAGLAHELRNPLHIIRGAAELLARRETDDESCQDILEEVDRVDRFIGDLLAYTRPAQADHDAVELAPMLRSVLSALDHDHPPAATRVTVRCKEGVVLGMSADHLRQIIRNLLANAIEALGDSAGRVHVLVEDHTADVKIVVQDEGQGIAACDLQRVFELFFTRREAGTGLGLAIVDRLVELYGGQIDIESQKGHGTRVTLLFAKDMGQDYATTHGDKDG